jgi:catechol-2,3-dioxygenase
VTLSDEIRGICELTLEAAEPEVLARFYAEALGLEQIDREGDRIWLACGELRELAGSTR